MSSYDEVGKLRMPRDDVAHERAQRPHLQAARANVCERAEHQPGADAALADRARHLGVRQRDDAGRGGVVGEGDMTVGFKLEAGEGGVVADG